jgi:uncharacterized MAPEG superfamily protein
MAKDRAALAEYPTLFRFQSAHNNTIEALGMMAPSFWVAHALGLEQMLFAKLATLFFLARLIYIFFYASDSDALRTCAFAIGTFSLLACGFGPLFPATVMPLLGV